MTNSEMQLLVCLEMHAEFTMLHDNFLVCIGVGAGRAAA